MSAIVGMSDASARGEHGTKWTWSLEQPEVSAWRWIETWDEIAMTFNVLRFHLGDTLAPNVACWRYIDPPGGIWDKDEAPQDKPPMECSTSLKAPAGASPRRDVDKEVDMRDRYADSIHVTEGGGIEIGCGGLVIVRPIREWHRLAMQDLRDSRVAPEMMSEAENRSGLADRERTATGGKPDPISQPEPRDRLGRQQRLEDALFSFRPDADEAIELLDSLSRALRSRYEGEARFSDVEHYMGQLRFYLARMT